MCRSIKKLNYTDLPVSDEEIRNASLQFVRKISGYHKPSKANEEDFNNAIEKISSNIRLLLKNIKIDKKSHNKNKSVY